MKGATHSRSRFALKSPRYAGFEKGQSGNPRVGRGRPTLLPAEPKDGQDRATRAKDENFLECELPHTSRQIPTYSNGFIRSARGFGSETIEPREISKSLTDGLPEAKQSGFSRRSVLFLAGAFGAAAPFGIFGAARALTTPPYTPGDSLICRAAASGEELRGPPRQIKLAWNANAACTVAAPVAKEHGIFATHNLDVILQFRRFDRSVAGSDCDRQGGCRFGVGPALAQAARARLRCSDHRRGARRLPPAPRLQGCEYRQS
jgi:hypothetical protein